MPGPTPYDTLGGTPGCRKLATAFYARVAHDPILRPFFPGKTFRCAIEELSAFLAQLLGGPPADAQFRWWLSLHESHRRFKIGPREREAWMALMTETLDEAAIAPTARAALHSFFEHSSAYIVNTGQCPHVDTPIHPAIAERWNAQRQIDTTVAAIRHGDAATAIQTADGLALQAHFAGNRSVFAALLAVMIQSAHPALLDYTRHHLSADPPLAHERYSGRTLLHAAAAAGNLEIVNHLLQLGANPNELDGGSHTPLYSVANECSLPGAASVVRALVQASANVDACAGVKHCTPLHMAARRGNVELAEALLDCGASINARDSLGVTPLGRAKNCRKPAVAALLIARGASPR